MSKNITGEPGKAARAARPPVGRRRSQRVARRIRMDASQRRAVVLNAAYLLAKRPDVGLMGFTWDDVIRMCEVTTSRMTARRSFQSLVELRKAVVERGRSLDDSAIVQQGARFDILN